jgi:hypothetical protein
LTTVTAGRWRKLVTSPPPRSAAIGDLSPTTRRKSQMLAAIEINLALWGMMLCAAVQAAQGFFY